MLGTLKPNKDSKEFELFITTAPIPDLSDKLIIFGRVIKGEDVVQVVNLVPFVFHYSGDLCLNTFCFGHFSLVSYFLFIFVI